MRSADLRESVRIEKADPPITFNSLEELAVFLQENISDISMASTIEEIEKYNKSKGENEYPRFPAGNSFPYLMTNDYRIFTIQDTGHGSYTVEFYTHNEGNAMEDEWQKKTKQLQE